MSCPLLGVFVLKREGERERSMLFAVFVLQEEGVAFFVCFGVFALRGEKKGREASLFLLFGCFVCDGRVGCLLCVCRRRSWR